MTKLIYIASIFVSINIYAGERPFVANRYSGQGGPELYRWDHMTPQARESELKAKRDAAEAKQKVDTAHRNMIMQRNVEFAAKDAAAYKARMTPEKIKEQKEKVIKYRTEKALGGDPKYQRMVADCYREGKEGFPTNIDMAKKYHEMYMKNPVKE